MRMIFAIGRVLCSSSPSSFSKPRQPDHFAKRSNHLRSLDEPLIGPLKVTAHICMKYLKQVLSLCVGGLAVLNTFAADGPAHPLHILYLGPVTTAGPRNGDGGRTTYAYLPG